MSFTSSWTFNHVECKFLKFNSHIPFVERFKILMFSYCLLYAINVLFVLEMFVPKLKKIVTLTKM